MVLRRCQFCFRTCLMWFKQTQPKIDPAGTKIPSWHGALRQMNQPCPVSNVGLERQGRTTHAVVTRQDVASQVREARELSSDASSFPDFFTEGDITRESRQHLWPPVHHAPIGLNDVGLVLVFVCICIIIHSIIPAFIGLGTA